MDKEDWVTILRIKPEHVGIVGMICSDTKAKDDTFRYEVRRSTFSPGEHVLFIHSSSKDQAHRRGTWLVKKALPSHGLNNFLYWVKKGD
jgi:hypothetical protein